MKWSFEGYEELYESDLMFINGGDSTGSSSGGGATTPTAPPTGSSSGGGATTTPPSSPPTSSNPGSTSGGGSSTPYSPPTGSSTTAGATTPYTGPAGSTAGSSGASGSISTGSATTPYTPPENGTGGTYPGSPPPPPGGWQCVGSDYEDWRMQGGDWTTKPLGKGETGETIGKQGCKVVAAAKILSSFANQAIDPEDTNVTYDSNGDAILTRDEIKAAFEANAGSGQTVSAFTLEANQINLQGLTNAALGSGQTYMLGRTSIQLADGHWSPHWVVLEGVTMVAGEATGFSVSDSSLNDANRKFTIGTTNAAQNQWAIDQIQVFKVY